MLEKFPPTKIIVGDLDPLLDESVDFNSRLQRLNVECELILLPGVSHGFTCHNGFVRAAQEAVDQSGQILLTFLQKNHEVR